MSAITTLEKMIKALLQTHSNPTAPIQDLYNKSTDECEKAEIEVLAWGCGIKIDTEKK